MESTLSAVVASWCFQIGRTCYYDTQKVCVSLSPTPSCSRSASRSPTWSRSITRTRSPSRSSSTSESSSASETVTPSQSKTRTASKSYIPTSPHVIPNDLANSPGPLAGVILGTLIGCFGCCFGSWYYCNQKRLKQLKADLEKEKQLRMTDQHVVYVPDMIPEPEGLRLTEAHGTSTVPSQRRMYYIPTTSSGGCVNSPLEVTHTSSSPRSPGQRKASRRATSPLVQSPTGASVPGTPEHKELTELDHLKAQAVNPLDARRDKVATRLSPILRPSQGSGLGSGEQIVVGLGRSRTGSLRGVELQESGGPTLDPSLSPSLAERQTPRQSSLHGGAPATGSATGEKSVASGTHSLRRARTGHPK
jgi:hypothetical protein